MRIVTSLTGKDNFTIVMINCFIPHFSFQNKRREKFTGLCGCFLHLFYRNIKIILFLASKKSVKGKFFVLRKLSYFLKLNQIVQNNHRKNQLCQTLYKQQ